jgi:AcrR family transcriptional regulator
MLYESGLMKRGGRRPGNPNTREAILVAARELFAAEGFDATTIRKVATAAGVDPALVHHYFGTKEDLFRAAVSAPVDPAEFIPKIFARSREEIPEALARTFLGVWDDPVTGRPFVAFLRTAVGNRVATKLVSEFFGIQIQRRALGALHTGIPAAEVPLRSTLVASQLLGLALTRYVLRFEPLASAPFETVVASITPALRHALYGPIVVPA